MNTRPDSHEYLPLAEPYVSLVPEGSITEILQQQHDETLKSLSDLTEEQANYKYAEGKWSLKQVVGHIADVERLWNYRILYIARGMPVNSRVMTAKFLSGILPSAVFR